MAATAAAVVQKTLTVKGGGGTGNGVVTLSPAGITCTITAGVAAASGCIAKFNQGVVVTLTPSTQLGHAFKTWYNACTGSGACKVTMSVNRTVAARFLKGPFTVKITSATAGSGSGRVKSQAGLAPVIDCVITNGTPATTGCSARYPTYTKVRLSAAPASGFVFAGWGESSCGTDACEYVVIQNKTVSAKFSAFGPELAGSWDDGNRCSPPRLWPFHVHLLTTGKVLLWGDKGDAQLWSTRVRL